MATMTLEKKRKNIDLPVDVLQRLSVLAASQGKSLKAFIEHLLVVKANSISVEVLENPSSHSRVFCYFHIFIHKVQVAIPFSKMQKIWLRFQHE